VARGATQVGGRRYDSQQTCPVARTLDVVGDRWTILILRDLAFGHRRFVDLQTSLAGIAPNLLTARLKGLEAAGMVRRVAYSERPPRARYELTDLGRDFIPTLRALADFGSRNLARPDGTARGMADRPTPLEQP
jgi:DNA-binding HxlR family transcriptional regulator